MSTTRTKETDEAHQPRVVVDFSNQIITSLLLSLLSVVLIMCNLRSHALTVSVP
jgi:hypothetical protein